MKLKREDVTQLGVLAKLAIDENTISDVKSRLENVLELVNQLQTADLYETLSLIISFITLDSVLL